MTVKETFFWIFIEDLQELDSLIKLQSILQDLDITIRPAKNVNELSQRDKTLQKTVTFTAKKKIA